MKTLLKFGIIISLAVILGQTYLLFIKGYNVDKIIIVVAFISILMNYITEKNRLNEKN